MIAHLYTWVQSGGGEVYWIVSPCHDETKDLSDATRKGCLLSGAWFVGEPFARDNPWQSLSQAR